MEERVRTLEAELHSSIREPLTQPVKTELSEKSCRETAETRPNCPLEIDSLAPSLNPDAAEFHLLTAVQEGEGTGARSGRW